MNRIRYGFLTLMLLLSLIVNAYSQEGDLGGVGEITDQGTCKGILSFRVTRFLASTTSTKLYVASWFVSTSDATKTRSSGRLKIFEKDGAEYKEVFNIEEKEGFEFGGFSQLPSLALPGIVVNFSSDLGGDGPVWVIALVQERFQIVYRGETSEIVDLDGDGVPEIFESIWPDGDGPPKSTTVHTWDGTKYKQLMTSKWKSRFSQSVLSRVTKQSKAWKKPIVKSPTVHPKRTGY